LGYIKIGFSGVVVQEKRGGFRFGSRWFGWGWVSAIKALRRSESVKHMGLEAIPVPLIKMIM
jgi:hypothetical protein